MSKVRFTESSIYFYLLFPFQHNENYT